MIDFYKERGIAIGVILFAIALLIICGISIYNLFLPNPFNNTELLKEFWELYIFCVILIAIGHAVIRERERHK